MGCERKSGVEGDSNCCGLSNEVSGGIIYWDEAGAGFRKGNSAFSETFHLVCSE